MTRTQTVLVVGALILTLATAWVALINLPDEWAAHVHFGTVVVWMSALLVILHGRSRPSSVWSILHLALTWLVPIGIAWWGIYNWGWRLSQLGG